MFDKYKAGATLLFTKKNIHGASSSTDISPQGTTTTEVPVPQTSTEQVAVDPPSTEQTQTAMLLSGFSFDLYYPLKMMLDNQKIMAALSKKVTVLPMQMNIRDSNLRILNYHWTTL